MTDAEPHAGESLLSFRGVSFRYPGTPAGTPPAIDGVDLELRPGDRVGVVGPNGGGKTTLVKLALGLFRPGQGEVRINGDVARWSSHVPRVGYIGNPSRNDGESGLPLDLTLGRLLDAHAALFGDDGYDRERAAELARRLDLDKPQWRAKPIAALSDGWRQRALAYLALAKGPALLIADEATAGLDPPHRRAVLAVIADTLASTDMAVLWVTHDHNELFALSLSRVYQVTLGRIEPVSLAGWRCEVAVDGGEPGGLDLTPDAVFKLVGELLTNPDCREVRLAMSRRPPGEVPEA